MEIFLICVLIVVNIPIIVFLGWLIFDDVRNASTDMMSTCMELLKALFISPWARMFMDDSESEGNVFNGVIFLVTCGLLFWGEFVLLQKIAPGVFDL